jgi:exopolysaccharide production protein ExoQ
VTAELISSVAIAGEGAPWRVRVLTAATLVLGFWFVGHSLSYSKTMLQESAISADRVENHFAEQQSETTTSSAVGYFILGGLGGVCLIYSAAEKVQWRPLLLALCGVYVAWCGLSMLWSVEPAQTFRKLAILGLMLIGSFGLARRVTLEDLVWVAVLSLGGFVAIGVLAEIVSGTFRPWRGDYRFSGTCHPNDQGLQCALLALGAGFAVWEGRDRPWLRRLVIAGALAGLALSKSRTTLAALVFAAAVALVLRSRGTQRWLVVSACLTGVALVGMAASFVSVAALDQTADVASMGRRENVTSLTGRLPLWHQLWKAADDHLVAGHGFGAFWGEKNVLRYSEIFSWHIPHGHNAYLDLVLTIGVVGGVLYLLWIGAAALLAAWQHERDGRPAHIFVVCLVLFSIVHGATESKFPGAGIGGFLLFAAIAATSIRPRHVLSHAVISPTAMTRRAARVREGVRPRAIGGSARRFGRAT